MAEWNVAWLAEYHNYSKCNMYRTGHKVINWYVNRQSVMAITKISKWLSAIDLSANRTVQQDSTQHGY